VSERREVDVFRFDELVRSIRRPSLMKIDAQGAELMVLRGMGTLIHEIDYFVIETSLIATIHEGPEFVDLVMLMKENGFVLFDVIAFPRRPLDTALAQIDAVFVPTNSPLRRDHRWAQSSRLIHPRFSAVWAFTAG